MNHCASHHVSLQGDANIADAEINDNDAQYQGDEQEDGQEYLHGKRRTVYRCLVGGSCCEYHAVAQRPSTVPDFAAASVSAGSDHDLSKTLVRRLHVEEGQSHIAIVEDGETLHIAVRPYACSIQLGSASKTVGSSMAALLTGASQGDQDYTGGAARETTGALQALASAARGLAATTSGGSGIEARVAIIDAARDVMDKSTVLVLEAKKALAEPANPDNQTSFAQLFGKRTACL